jgi:riboflavin kinase/FMN adenylyltransferase
VQVIADAMHASELPHGVIATIGNYDGIHIGQRSVLDLVRSRARHAGLLSAVVTFDPHPMSVLRPEPPVIRLTTAAQKEALLDEVGMDLVVVIRFTPEFSRLPARSFVRDFLHERLGAKEIYVGSRFAFGHRRGGDLSLLQQMGESFGFSAFAVDEVTLEGEAVSSTRIRKALLDGEVALAQRLLGRSYEIGGLVARGDQVGRSLGFPTINVAPDNELLPLDGVYATEVYFPSQDECHRAVTNVGTRPTLYDSWRRVVESHLLDFDLDVYGEQVVLRFHERLREEKKFPSMMHLAEQIGRDAETARAYFAARELRSAR